MPLNWSNDHKFFFFFFKRTPHLNRLVICVTSHFPSLFLFLLVLLFTLAYSIFSETLSQPNMPKNKPPLMLRWPLHQRLVMHQQCFSYPPKKKKKMIRSKDLPFVSFIALKIIYFFYCIFLYKYLIDFLLNVFQIFIICMKRNWVCACQWPRLVGG